MGALARLLDTRTFDQISVAELATAAQCSVSSFYARFPTKASLLNAFFDRFFEYSAGEVGAAFTAIASAATTEQRARGLIEFLLRSYRGHRGLLRSLILHDRTHPDSGFAGRTRAYKQQVGGAVVALMLGGNPRAADERTAASVRFRLWLVVQTIEQIVLFEDPLVGRGLIPESQLVEELVSVLVRPVSPNRAEVTCPRPS
jgi:AcrR family transcriptional regulator